MMYKIRSNFIVRIKKEKVGLARSKWNLVNTEFSLNQDTGTVRLQSVQKQNRRH